MKNLLSPKWLIIINIIPVIILMLIFYVQFNIISTLLTGQSKQLWLDFGIMLCVLTIIQVAYITFCIVKKYPVSLGYALISIISYSFFLYLYAQSSDNIIPFNIPQWMVSFDFIFYPGTFLMPTLFHALLILVVISSKNKKTSKAWPNFLYGISIPIIGYLFLQVILPLLQKPEESFGMHTLTILFIVASILFLFFICRGIYLLTVSNSANFLKYSILWKVVISIVLPLLGLCIHNGVFSFRYGIGSSVFGDFSNPLFYIIAAVNGIFICLPGFKNNLFRLIRLLSIAICFPYSLYFLLVFLPFLPLAVVAVIAVGIGFLMLAPLFLFILQVNELYKEYTHLKSVYSPVKLTGATIMAILTLPFVITAFNLYDKKVLNNALEYVYSPDYTKTYAVDQRSLHHTLQNIKKNKGLGISLNGNTPFLTPYYNWLVLDNLILSDEKINNLGHIFFGERPEVLLKAPVNVPSSIKLSEIKNISRFDSRQKSWVSTIDLTLSNTDTLNLRSYETEFTLPTGSWISNYSLNIGDKKEYGLLTEKKAALWVFSQIRNENRDPGILYYLTGYRIALKIFPFSAKETRKTSLEIIHKEPITFKIDGKAVFLGSNALVKNNQIDSVNGTIYIPANAKAKLPLIKRIPHYHFIIDISKDKSVNQNNYVQRVSRFISEHKINTNAVTLHFTNAFSSDVLYSNNWASILAKQSFQGGFYLDGVVKKILVGSYGIKSNFFPVIITVTDALENSIVQNDFADFKITYPESPNFYELDRENNLWAHSFISNPKLRVSNSREIQNDGVYAYPNQDEPIAYLIKNDAPSIVINHKPIKVFSATPKKSWISGLNLEGMWLRNVLLSTSDIDTHLDLVKQSMLKGVLTPATSYIVVENEAQKKALIRKQNQILSGNKNLDPDDETQRMDEPNLYVLMALLCFCLIYYRRNKSLKILYN